MAQHRIPSQELTPEFLPGSVDAAQDTVDLLNTQTDTEQLEATIIEITEPLAQACYITAEYLLPPKLSEVKKPLKTGRLGERLLDWAAEGTASISKVPEEERNQWRWTSDGDLLIRTDFQITATTMNAGNGEELATVKSLQVVKKVMMEDDHPFAGIPDLCTIRFDMTAGQISSITVTSPGYGGTRTQLILGAISHNYQTLLEFQTGTEFQSLVADSIMLFSRSPNNIQLTFGDSLKLGVGEVDMYSGEDRGVLDEFLYDQERNEFVFSPRNNSMLYSHPRYLKRTYKVPVDKYVGLLKAVVDLVRTTAEY